MELPRLLKTEPPPNLQPELRAWFAGSLGQSLLGNERQLLERLLPDLFGYHAVQLGDMVPGRMLSSSRILHRVVADPAPVSAAESLLVCEPDQLPLPSDSVDLVLVHHLLDVAQQPHAILREAARVLIPEGHLLIVGFNPWSLWGVWRWLLMPVSGQPWLKRPLSPQRLVDWLALLDFDVVGLESVCFVPPVEQPAIRRRLQWLERAGRRWWRQNGAAYMVLATKRRPGMTPVRQQQRVKRQQLLAPVVWVPEGRHAGKVYRGNDEEC